MIENNTIKGTSGLKDSQKVGCFKVLQVYTLYTVIGADIPKLPTEKQIQYEYIRILM